MRSNNAQTCKSFLADESAANSGSGDFEAEILEKMTRQRRVDLQPIMAAVSASSSSESDHSRSPKRKDTKRRTREEVRSFVFGEEEEDLLEREEIWRPPRENTTSCNPEWMIRLREKCEV